MSSTATTRRSATWRAIARTRSPTASTTLAHARPTLQHAADSRYCVRCGQPYEFAAAYVGHLGDYRCPACGHGRPALQVRATEIELDGLRCRLVPARDARRRARLRLPLPGLYNVYNALGAAALAQSLGASLEEIRDGPRAVRRSVRPLRADPGGRQDGARAPDQEPGRRERGRAHAARGGAPSLLLVALNDAIADGKDVSWIWDVDFEPLLGRTERLIAVRRPGGGAGRCAASTAGCLRPRSRWSRRSAAPRPGLELTPPGGELVVLPTYTAMLELQRIVAERGWSKPYWERTREDPASAISIPSTSTSTPTAATSPCSRGGRRSAGTSSPCGVSVGDEVEPGAHDLLYIGGGQDREQALIAPDLVAKGPAIAQAVANGAALLAVCGGYQLLGRGYLGRHGDSMPGIGLFPHETVAGEKRMIGDVLLECELVPGERRTIAGFENHIWFTLPGQTPRRVAVRWVRPSARERHRGRETFSRIRIWLCGDPRRPCVALRPQSHFL